MDAVEQRFVDAVDCSLCSHICGHPAESNSAVVSLDSVRTQCTLCMQCSAATHRDGCCCRPHLVAHATVCSCVDQAAPVSKGCLGRPLVPRLVVAGVRVPRGCSRGIFSVLSAIAKPALQVCNRVPAALGSGCAVCVRGGGAINGGAGMRIKLCSEHVLPIPDVCHCMRALNYSY